MLPTLLQLCRSLDRDLVCLSPDSAPGVEVSAVHVSELVDPTPYLTGGELLLTTGLTLQPSAAWCRDYIRRLVRAEVAGLALGLGPAHEQAPVALKAAAARSGLPLLTVPAETPFLSITRCYWTMLADAGQRELAATLGAHRTLLAGALSSQPRSAILRRLALATGGWAAELSPTGELRGVWPHDRRARARELQAAVSELGVQAASSFSSRNEEVLVQPLGAGADELGYLAMGQRGAWPAYTHQLAMTAVALLSLQASHAAKTQAAGWQTSSVTLELLRRGEGKAARALADAAGLEIPLGLVRPVLLDGRARTELLRALEQLPASRTHLVLAGELDGLAGALLQPTEDAGQWLRPLLRRIPGTRVVLGVPVPVDDLAAAWGQLRAVLADAPAGTVTDLREPPTPAGAALDSPETRVWAHARLAPLTNRPELLATLAGYLRARGDHESAAQAVGVHRHTVRNRVRRIEAILGASLGDPDTSSELWLALRLSGLG